jgi:hypothetical protein
VSARRATRTGLQRATLQHGAALAPQTSSDSSRASTLGTGATRCSPEPLADNRQRYPQAEPEQRPDERPSKRPEPALGATGSPSPRRKALIVGDRPPDRLRIRGSERDRWLGAVGLDGQRDIQPRVDSALERRRSSRGSSRLRPESKIATGRPAGRMWALSSMIRERQQARPTTTPPPGAPSVTARAPLHRPEISPSWRTILAIEPERNALSAATISGEAVLDARGDRRPNWCAAAGTRCLMPREAVDWLATLRTRCTLCISRASAEGRSHCYRRLVR